MENADCTYMRSDALLITKSISLVTWVRAPLTTGFVVTIPTSTEYPRRINSLNTTFSMRWDDSICLKKSGIGAGNVGADIVALEKSIEDMVEGDVGVLAVFGAESRKICTFGQYWFRMLDFVNEDIAW